MAKGAVNTEYAALSDDEFEKVDGGDFLPVHDFEDNPVLTGKYLGVETVTAKGKPRTIHTFETGVGDEGKEQVWGTVVLDDRLQGLEGVTVRIKRLGKVPTKTGNTAWAWEVLVARSAFKGR